MKFYEGQPVAVWTNDGFKSATVISTQRAFGMFDSKILPVRMPDGRVHYADRKELRLQIMNGRDESVDRQIRPNPAAANLIACREMLHQARAERDQARGDRERLRQNLVNAPHPSDCMIHAHLAADRFCDCWKARL